MANQTPTQAVHYQKVWDRSTRLFHWINALSVILLIIIGTMILNAKTLGIEGEAKVLLKFIHTIVGYTFAVNLLWRLIWGFFGNRFARWGQILPFYRGFGRDLKSYKASLKNKKPETYVGHNPLARLIISLFYLLLTVQAISGLVLAGTDLYMPPFGQQMAEWVTNGDPERLALLEPGDKTHVVAESYKEMRDFRSPFITAHYYIFYVLLGLVILHLVGVIVAEFKERSGLISAMIHGEKVISDTPKDAHLIDKDK